MQSLYLVQIVEMLITHHGNGYHNDKDRSDDYNKCGGSPSASSSSKFKMKERSSKAGDAFIKAANMQLQLNERDEASTTFINASKCYRKCSFEVLLDNKKKDLIYTKCYCEENIYHLCKEFLLDEKNEDYKEGIYVCFISNEDKVVPLFRQSSSELENGLVLWIDKDGMWNSPPPNYPPISNQEFTMNLDLFISMTENLNSDKFGKIELHNPLRCEENMTKFKDFLNQIKYDGPILASTESIKLISKLHYHPKLECILSSILPLSEIKVSSFEDIDDIVNKD
ncbi:4499_t:CDS:2 [Entrophospora sp. SA101]|nr:4499_t:CDS:2 [Entrophospora sp. SA101]